MLSRSASVRRSVVKQPSAQGGSTGGQRDSRPDVTPYEKFQVNSLDEIFGTHTPHSYSCLAFGWSAAPKDPRPTRATTGRDERPEAIAGTSDSKAGAGRRPAGSLPPSEPPIMRGPAGPFRCAARVFVSLRQVGPESGGPDQRATRPGSPPSGCRMNRFRPNNTRLWWSFPSWRIDSGP